MTAVIRMSYRNRKPTYLLRSRYTAQWTWWRLTHRLSILHSTFPFDTVFSFSLSLFALSFEFRNHWGRYLDKNPSIRRDTPLVPFHIPASNRHQSNSHPSTTPVSSFPIPVPSSLNPSLLHYLNSLSTLCNNHLNS